MVLLGQITSETSDLGWPVVAASLLLVLMAVGFAAWLRLGVTGSIAVASMRAAVQLLAVGLILTSLFESPVAEVGAWGWVAVMVGIAAYVIGHRARAPSRELYAVAGITVALSTAVSLLVVFSSGVFEPSPVAIVVMAGITIGNAMPSAVLGVNRAVESHQSGCGQIEALLSLGMTRGQVVRFMSPPAARSALIPQIERTKVVGLIALPGAMTGLLLAGVEPVDAVLIQMLVMYLVLGATALCAVITVAAVSRSSVTPSLVVATWVREP